MTTAQPPTQPLAADGKKPSSGRFVYLDIFRGLAVAGMILVDNPGSDDGAYWPIKHAEWNGWTPADFIFPSFCFLLAFLWCFHFRRDSDAASHASRSCFMFSDAASS